MFPKMREPVSGLTHLGGAIASAGGLAALLILSWQGIEKILSAFVYGLSLVGLFAASAAYHLARVRPKAQELLRKLDHAAIYLLIAGTYTPFCLVAFSGFWRWGLLAIVWLLAGVGILVKIFTLHASRWLSAGLYLLLGWLCLAAIGEMLAVLPAFVLAWLVTGGVIYTLGALVYITRALDFWPGCFGYHEVWHIFVLLGAAAHFMAVLGVIWPGSG